MPRFAKNNVCNASLANFGYDQNNTTVLIYKKNLKFLMAGWSEKREKYASSIII
jgi:hypothetical protein